MISQFLQHRRWIYRFNIMALIKVNRMSCIINTWAISWQLTFSASRLLWFWSSESQELFRLSYSTMTRTMTWCAWIRMTRSQKDPPSEDQFSECRQCRPRWRRGTCLWGLDQLRHCCEPNKIQALQACLDTYILYGTFYTRASMIIKRLHVHAKISSVVMGAV